MSSLLRTIRHTIRRREIGVRSGRRWLRVGPVANKLHSKLRAATVARAERLRTRLALRRRRALARRARRIRRDIQAKWHLWHASQME